MAERDNATGNAGRQVRAREYAAAANRHGRDLGVLVVHGIGDQRQGATLTTWVDAIADWLGTRSVDARVLAAQLHPPDGPAHVDLRVDPERGATQDWLFAEGWWANTFEPPSFGELWGWTFVSVPATAAMHANTMVTGAIRRLRSAYGPQRIYEALRLVVMLMFLALLVMVSPLILGLFTALFLLGIIASVLPIDAIRTAVLKAQLISIGTIGDTKRLIDSPTQAGAIKRPVIDGIRWLRDQGCRRVVVLAHSQGAAVAYQALADIGDGFHGPVRPVDSFISVGSGLPKVHQLRFLTSRAGAMLRIASLAVPAAAVITALSVRFLVNDDAALGLIVMGAIGLVTAVAVAGLGIVGRRRTRRIATRAFDTRAEREAEMDNSENRRRIAQLGTGILGIAAAIFTALPFDQSVVTLLAAGAIATALGCLAALALHEIPPLDNDLSTSTRRWMDLWASVDPVPAGPTRTKTTGRPESWRVTNLGSMLRDHNAYPVNRDECMSFIGNELGDIAGLFWGRAAADLRLNRNERRWRVGWRSFVAYLTAAAAAVFAWTTWRGADDALRRVYGEVMQDDGLVDTWYPGDLPGFVPNTMSAGAAEIVSIIGYLVIGLVAVQVANAAWATWNAVAAGIDLELQAEGDVERSSSDAARPAFAVMIGLVVVAWFVAVVPRRVWSSWQSLDLTSWRGLAVVVGAIAAAFAIGRLLPVLLVRTNIKRWAMRRDTSRIDGLVAYGDYQLRELNDPQAALESLTAACDFTSQARHHNADALAGRARALLALAPLRRIEATQQFYSASHRAERAFEADFYERDALRMYAAACELDHLVTAQTRLEYVDLLDRIGRDIAGNGHAGADRVVDQRGSRAASAERSTADEIARQLHAANDRRGGHVPTLIALLAHNIETGNLDPPWATQLDDAIVTDDGHRSPADELAARFALHATGHEACDEPRADACDDDTGPLTHVARIDTLLAEDVRVEPMVIAPIIRRLDHAVTSPHVSALHTLAARLTATVETVVDITEPSRAPRHEVNR